MSEQQRLSNLCGRGANVLPRNPYLNQHIELDLEQTADDEGLLRELRRPVTEYFVDDSQSIVATNKSPDISFKYSINPYRGCAHGCSYCYARPTHEYLGLTAGIDFETKVFYKPRAPELFREFLARPAWSSEPIAFSGVTDCYQPVERKLGLTRACLEVAVECRQPVTFVTKNALITRDLVLLQELADHRAVRVAISVTTLDQQLSRVMEPRTSSPAARLAALERLSKAGVETVVMVAPIIPGLNDHEIPRILSAARSTGVQGAAYVLLRLPSTVQPVFLDWLTRHRPNHATKVQSFIRSTRSGKLYNARFGKRQRGEGVLAEQISRTFQVFAKRLSLDRRLPALNCADFRPPRAASGQLTLF